MPATTKIRPLPPEIRERLGKLLPLLSSPHDGERIGALAAIERVLEADGLDWFDFAGAFTRAEQTTSPPPPPPPPPSPPPSHELDQTIPGADLRAIIETLRARRRFNAKLESFLDRMIARASRYGSVYVSEKQWAWLSDLAHQAGVV